MTKLHLAPLCLLVACAGTGEPPSEPIAATTEPPPPDLVLDFAHSGQLKQFEYTSPRMWRPYQESLELLGKSPYEPPHRSPHSIALLRTEPLGDFVLENDYSYCYLTYFGAKGAVHMVNGFWERAEQLGRDRNPYRLGFLIPVGAYGQSLTFQAAAILTNGDLVLGVPTVAIYR